MNPKGFTFIRAISRLIQNTSNNGNKALFIPVKVVAFYRDLTGISVQTLMLA